MTNEPLTLESVVNRVHYGALAKASKQRLIKALVDQEVAKSLEEHNQFKGKLWHILERYRPDAVGEIIKKLLQKESAE